MLSNKLLCVKWRLILRRIKQEDPTGCGLACIAILAGVSYTEIRKIAVDDLEFDESGLFYTGTTHLRKLASKYNIKLSKRRRQFKSLEALPEKAILAINYDGNVDTWHWVIYRRTLNEEFVYDPKRSIKSNKRTDFSRMKIKWFLQVTKI